MQHVNAVHAALDGLTAAAALHVLAAVCADFAEWASETGPPTDPNEGIELQWVDTNDLSPDGQPRVLTFDECAIRGLDGTGRTT